VPASTVIRALARSVAAAALAAGCSSTERGAPHLPDGRAGEILERAIDASGGWENWKEKRAATIVSTTTISNPAAGTTSETLGLYRFPLHDYGKVRFDSLGLIEAVAVGFDGKDVWLLRDGRPVAEPGNMDVPRFNVVSTAFWFGLPFRLAELPVTITDEGDQTVEGETYSRLRVTVKEDAPETPGDWFVISFDQKTGLIHHLVGHITAPFLAHRLWVGFWRDFQPVGGLLVERRRRFFPSDESGKVIGDLVVDQLVEHVRFASKLPEDLFHKPTGGGGRSQVVRLPSGARAREG
jgi:hypothetical protein